MRSFLALIVLGAAAGRGVTPAPAQGPPNQAGFTPIPAADAPAYHIDLARHYFATADGEVKDRLNVLALVGRAEGLRGRVAATPELLEQTLVLIDSTVSALSRHQAYLTLRSWMDVSDIDSRNAQARLSSEVQSRTSFVVSEIRGLPDNTLAAYYTARPSLARYRYSIDQYRRDRPPPALGLEAADLLRKLEPFLQDWQANLYNQMFARRADAKQEGETYAFTLIQRARSGTEVARLNGYASAAERAYATRSLGAGEVEGVINALAARGELNKRYERARIAFLKRKLSRDTIGYFADYLAPPPSAGVPRFTIDQARHMIAGALAPLGSPYSRELAALLDPANRRLDIVSGPNRAGGGTTPTALPGSAVSVFYMAGYSGSFGDVMTLAHEAGHAVHFQLMNAAGVPAVYGNGPQYLTEAFPYFNELLLTDYLYREEASPLRKTFFAEQFLDRAFQAFTQARDAAFEAAFYDSVAAGRIRQARDVSALFDAIGARYSVWHGLDPDLSLQWIRIPHYFRTPFYRVNYMYARLLALRLFELYRRDPTAFVPRYLALLRDGYSAPPPDLLRRHLGIDVEGQALVRDAVASLEPRVSALEASYK